MLIKHKGITADSESGLIVDFDMDEMMDHLCHEWREDKDSQRINLNIKLQAALNKCPGGWTTGTAQYLGLSPKGTKREKVARIVPYLWDPKNLETVVFSLPEGCQQALKTIVEQGGWVKYSVLSNRFGDEFGDSWFWAEKPPQSIIGQLRLAGLVFIGKTPIKSRMYKAAVVPTDLREPLQALISGESASGSKNAAQGKANNPQRRPSGQWVRDDRTLKDEKLVAFVQKYANRHFLSPTVKSVRVKTRGADVYLYATQLNQYQSQLSGKQVWDELELARLKWAGGDQYVLGYFRHTGRWQDIDIVGSVKECLEAIRENAYGLFWA